MRSNHTHSKKSGSALIMVLWTVIIMSLLIGTFAYEMHIEAKIATLQRQRFKAQEIARAGFEYAKAILAAPQQTEEEKDVAEVDEFQSAADRVRRGLSITGMNYELPDGKFTLSIETENNKRNINKMSEDDWMMLLELSGIPSTEQDKLIDCYIDWIDEGDLHGLNGAESDDPFYEERGYSCKNAPVETIEELLLIKHFNETILYGGTTEEGDKITGIADKLTVWGDGKVNVNSASEDVLMTFIEFEEGLIDGTLELRNGLDGEEGTEDDGFNSTDETLLGASDKLTTQGSHLRITSQAKTDNFIYEIQSVAVINGEELKIVRWNESFLEPETNTTQPEKKESFENL